MADIKRFTGFIAPDGSTHTSMKKATEHTTAIKVLEALKKDFGEISSHTHGENVRDGLNDGTPGVSCEDMPMFLLDNREKIEACFAASATLRAPRQKKKVKTDAPQTLAP